VWALWETAFCVVFQLLWRVLGVHRDDSVHALRRGTPLERGRTDLAECRMAPSLVIEHLDVIEQGLFGVGVTLEALTL